MNWLHFFSVSLISLHALFCTAQISNLQNGTVVFRVGVVLDLDSLVGRVGLSCLSMALSDFYSIHDNYTTKIVLHIADSKGHVIDAAASAQISNLQNGTVVFRVGVVLDLDSLVGRVGLSCLSMALSDFYSIHDNYTTKIVLHIADSKGQVIDAAASALSLIKNTRVNAIIGPQKSSEAIFVTDLGDRAHVPVISFSATSPSLLPRTPYFVQTAQSDATQVGAISSIVKAFQWTEVVIIYEDSEYGNGIIPYLANAFQDIDAQVTYRCIIPLSATDDFVSKELYKMMAMQTRVFVVHLSHSISTRLFLKAKEIGMMSEGYAWMVTSGLMDLLYTMDSHVVEAMQGVLGVKPRIPNSEKLDSFALRWKRNFLQDNPTIKQAEISSMGLWAYDTFWALALAAETVGTLEPIAVASTIGTNFTELFNFEVIQKGSELLTAILQTRFQGLSGEFRLVNGELQPSPFQILNVVGKGEREVGIWTPLLGVSREPSMNVTKTYSASMENFRGIIWPGESTIVPKGWEIPVSGKKLRIGVPVKDFLTEFVRIERDLRTNSTSVTGYCIDVFDSVVEELPYALQYEYVPFANPDGSSAGHYEDLIYQIFLQKFDAVVGDVIITANRSQYADFTLPYAEGGISMIVPIKYEYTNNDWTFLKPLKGDLWITIIIFFILTGFAVWILEHRINDEFRGPPSQHVGMIFWFSFSSLVFAQRERIMSNFARLVVVVWIFVVLVLSSSYTASLSSRLTVQSLQPTVTNVGQLIQYGDYVGHEEGAFVSEYLKGMGFKQSKLKPFKSVKDIDESLSNGSISAFFEAAPHTKLFFSLYCKKYMIVGPVHPTSGVAFAFQKGSPLVADVSRALLKAAAIGKISKIEKMWFGNQICTGPESSISSNSLSLQNFGGLFIITGSVTTTCVVVYLVIFLCRHRGLIRRNGNSGTTMWSSICAICRQFDQRELSAYPMGENGGTDDQCIELDIIRTSSQSNDTPGLARTSHSSEKEVGKDANGSSHQNIEDIDAKMQ